MALDSRKIDYVRPPIGLLKAPRLYRVNMELIKNCTINLQTVLNTYDIRAAITGLKQYLHQTVGMCKGCGYTWVVSSDVLVSSKSRVAALILCVLFGYFGAHHFYVGKKGMGILYLFTVGLCGIGWIVDIVLLATGKFKDAAGNPLR